MSIRGRERPAPAPLRATGSCGMSIDLPLGEAVAAGDWVATQAGSRYLVVTARRVASGRHAQRNRWAMRCSRLPKHEPVPDDVQCWWMSWYPRARGAR